MGKPELKKVKKISAKKKYQAQIMETLASSLPGLKEILGDRKFDGRIKKAAKLLSEGIKDKGAKKIKKGKEKTNKKKTETSEPVAKNNSGRKTV